MSGRPVTQTDATVNFNWNASPAAAGVPGEWFSARWEGMVVPRYSQSYTFYTQADDGVRLWVNGQLLVNDWNYHGVVEQSGSIALVAGQSYDIRLEYFQGCCGSSVALLWSSASQGKEVIPNSQLFVPASSGAYRSNALNQYTQVAGQTLGYDGNFNLTSYDGATFTYNAQNQLMSASNDGVTIQFVYDGMGRCVKRTTNGAPTVITYDGWKPTVEWDGNGNVSALNLYGPGADEILYRYIAAGGQRLRYHHDIHGNVTFVLDFWSGAVIEKYTYDAFGRPTILSGSGTQLSTSGVGNRFLFQGREWIPELGIYDYRHRMYHPGVGRFLQTDPLGFSAGDMNLFRYCGDDPVDRSDPLGLYKIDPRGLTPEQVKQAEEAQKATADLVAGAAARVDRALEAGADSKELKSVKEGYEKANGKGSATEKNLREFAKTARKMETALRDDGTKGYVMTAKSQDWFVTKWNDARVLGDGDVGGKRISINLDKVFKSKSVLRWTIGHESAHNAGMVDYWYKHQPEYHTVMTREESLENADSYMDFITSR